MLLVLNRDLPAGMLNRSRARISPDGVGPRHIPYGIKGSWEGSLQGNYVLDHSCGERGSPLSQLHLRGRLVYKVRGTRDVLFEGRCGLDMGFDGDLHSVPFIVEDDSGKTNL